jgi:predicted ArsR family transcriptional regulator
MTPGNAADRVVDLLEEHGFEPERENGNVLMHRCPFRDLAAEHGDVVCSVHLGLIRGALAEIGAPVTATRLEPFVEPSLCRARLGKPEL